MFLAMIFLEHFQEVRISYLIIFIRIMVLL